MKVLITGGAGYIGSTIASYGFDAGIEIVVLDDLSTGRPEFVHHGELHVGDIGDTRLVDAIVDRHPDIDAVIHCAARIVVPESMEKPLDYYDNNVAKTISLVRALTARGIHRFVFSSTASMYASSGGEFVDEDSPVAPQSPYSASKHMVERILQDACTAGLMSAVVLRYFNPIGADPDMRSGLQSTNPSHALGKMIEASNASGTFTVTGTTWPTRDGSGLRDYVHVWDLARAHILALQRFDDLVRSSTRAPYQVINLGTGTGTTVFELLSAFESVVDAKLAVTRAEARPGDVAGCAPLTSKAEELLGWSAERSLEQGVADSLAWAPKLAALLAASPSSDAHRGVDR
ncbi:UDP-glucose 4-epimerase GalE [Clavibacter capsici]|uniref:UDP-glucose 4-epimerase n=1 Tax=Clavibacter capsici TaxID=1874630 RepID=A0A0M4HD20_9MICO|nr:UDP-glucose 4-epimerase GalE [Clavibacter capsici]ALD12096.1 UDP-glucose 4-epimerase [Clavibacter capsici]QIS38453.1 UDP-glucose 4-epimerase GalE [Clavibacter capsici]QIS41250.1 UDP-glucose 4-epimerase GalE [Clavibacter capsici]QIS44194.1 UDP-glucose 4-epimerase GalE [Clavibacter capsici]